MAPPLMVVVVLIASAGNILSSAENGYFDSDGFHNGVYHDGKYSPDSDTQDPWSEIDERMMEEFPTWGGANRDWEKSWEEARERMKDAWHRSERRGEEVWDKMNRRNHEIWEKVFQNNFPTGEEDDQMVEKSFPFWDGKWNGEEGDFFSSDSDSAQPENKIIKFGPIKNCSKEGDLIIITSPPTISPPQVQAGDTVSIKFAATLKKPIDGGQVKVDIATVGIPFFSRSLDICTLLAQAHMKCPLQGTFSFEDNPLKFVVPQQVASIPSRTYSVKAVGTNKAGQELACLETVLTVQ